MLTVYRILNFTSTIGIDDTSNVFFRRFQGFFMRMRRACDVAHINPVIATPYVSACSAAMWMRQEIRANSR